MILIITSKRDGHIQYVTKHFGKNQKWVRLNTEDIPNNIEISINPLLGNVNIAVKDSKKQFTIADIQSVWYRKPESFDLSFFNLDRESLKYIDAEFNEVLKGIYALLDNVLWLNNPFKTQIANRKFLQKKVAKHLGFNVPKTIITNSIYKAEEFAESVNWNLAVKSLSALSVSKINGKINNQYGMFTRRIDRTEFELLKKNIPNMPTLFQEYIEKEYELRITCVGEKCFTCKIHSQNSNLTKEDFRFDTRLSRHEIIKCPEIEKKSISYLKYFDINFGCFDIGVTRNGEHYFFECNTNGQWAWIERLTGAQIGRAIADFLI